MAYVRRHGNQLAIVHGERDPENGKVQQRVLFTLYSKAEALRALGRREPGGAIHFQNLLEHAHPRVRFDWAKVRRGIRVNMDHLPELYEYRGPRLLHGFRQGLTAFARQLILTDPQDFVSAARLIEEQRHELEYLSDLIQWRLKLRRQEMSNWNRDDPFYWNLAFRRNEVPSETLEQVAGLYERGEYERAEAVCRLLIECFPTFADGHNYLGLIALDQDKPEESIAHFEKTIEVGRRLFPKRLGKKHYWRDISTRPYIRGLRNLALSLNRAGRYVEALSVCERLDHECGDDITAASMRAAIYLNTGRWQLAKDAAHHVHQVMPAESFIVAFASFELGNETEALAFFLHGALNHPGTAPRLVRCKARRPRTRDEWRDQETARDALRDLAGYMARHSLRSRSFFRGTLRKPDVAKLLEEMEAVVQRWHAEHPTDERVAFDRMQIMRSPEFAWETSRSIMRPASDHTEPPGQVST